jgi:hypothetical protein
LCKVLALRLRDCHCLENPRLGYFVSGPRYDTRTSRIRPENASHSTQMFGPRMLPNRCISWSCVVSVARREILMNSISLKLERSSVVILRLRLHWSQKRHNTTVWTDTRQGSSRSFTLCSRSFYTTSDTCSRWRRLPKALSKVFEQYLCVDRYCSLTFGDVSDGGLHAARCNH